MIVGGLGTALLTCPTTGTCPTGYTLSTSTSEFDINPNYIGGGCNALSCLDSNGSVLVGETCNQIDTFFQPTSLLCGAIGLGILVTMPGISKILAIAPIGYAVLLSALTQMIWDPASGKCVATGISM